MDAESRWRRVRELFERVVELAPAERRAHLEALEGEARELRGEVERLLAAEDCGDSFLNSPFARDDDPGLVGHSLGGFRVVRRIASGGMGHVWEAEQDEPRRRVALKTLRADLASPQGRRRFQFEAELLAGLRHPAIAQVYGAGVLRGEGGALPWFALEFIEGATPLVQHAERARLDLAQRLRLLLEVCEAVQHAHQRGVVHRDLKAGNLLVDADGHVKVIDFGIARLLEREAGPPATRYTFAGEILGTLEAMSPEQIAGRGEDVDTRTDVWALGAVLYELVSGRLPFDLSDLSLPEAARRVCETEPPPPTRVAHGLPRELDWIVATAMAKEPERRYASVADLARDLERLLAREPVLAGPPSRTYRLRKFCERHRIGVASASLGLAVLAVGLAGSVYGMLERDRAQQADQAAELEADMTQRLVRHLGSTLEEAQPTSADGLERTPAERLENSLEWIQSETGGRPLVQAELLRKAGTVFVERGEYEQARAPLTQAVELARAQGAEGASELSLGLHALGSLHRHVDQDELAGACLREALALQERLYGADDVRLSLVLNELGLLLRNADPRESEQHFTRSLELLRSKHGDEHGDTAVVLANLGGLALRSRRYAQARDMMQSALPVLEREHGGSDPRVANLLANLASAHLSLGDYQLADELQRREIEVSRRVLPEGHPHLGASYQALARISERLGHPERALEESQVALEILERQHPPEHPMLLSLRQDRARLLLHLGRADEARAEVELALDARPNSFDGRLARLGCLAVLGRIERLAGDADASLALTDELLQAPESAMDGLLLTAAHWERAYAWLALEDRGEAERERERALAHLPPGSNGDPFGDAVFATLAGEPQAALPMLAREVGDGYQNRLLLFAPELAPLRALAGFEPIRAALERTPDE